MSVIEIPLTPQAQSFTITLGATVYSMRITWDAADEGGWILDIGTEGGAPLIAGIPMVPGTDLLAQYAYLGFGGALVVTTDRGAGETPTYEGLGLTSHLFFVPAS